MTHFNHWLLPDGIEEILPEEAARIETARRFMLDLFKQWGYRLVITPNVEFMDTSSGQPHDIELQTFKTIDPVSGRLLGFRSDITPQVTRLDAHWLKNTSPTRLCYVGSVLLTKPRAHSTSRSPIQMGAELYGDNSLNSDIEIISLMLETLALANIDNIHLDLGHVCIFRALAQAAQLTEQQEQALFNALQRKAIDEVVELTHALPKAQAAMLQALPTLCGDKQVLNQARQLFAEAPIAVLEAIDMLEIMADTLTQRYPHISLYFDLTELRGYHYYTGIVFAAYTPQRGQAIAQGGHYDGADMAFGYARPATGFSTDLKTLVTLGQADFSEAHTAIWAPCDADKECWQQITQLRQAGHTVIQALPHQTSDDAERMGCTKLLDYLNHCWQVVPIKRN